MGSEDTTTRKIMGAEYIRRLTGDENTPMTYQVFDDTPNKDKSKARIYNGTLKEHFDTLDAANSQGCGIYATVNTTDLKGRKESNIIGIRAVLADDDDGLNSVSSFPLRPHMAVRSSRKNGIEKKQFFWCTSGGELALAQYDGVINRVITDYRTCSGATKVNRVMRVPGFYHMKDPNDPQLVEIIHYTDDLPYSWEQILKAFPPIGNGTTRAKKIQEAFSNDPVLARLRAAGNVLSECPDGKIHIKCPFESLHGQASSESSTTYFVAYTGGYAKGHFKCMHDHCSERTDQDFLKAIGYDEPEREPGDEPADEPDKSSFELVDADDLIKDMSPPDFLIDRYIEAGTIAQMFGPWGQYKTFVAVSIAGSVATGLDWMGNAVKQGPVVYILGEGHGGFRRRLRAWCTFYGVKDFGGMLMVSRKPAQLTQKESAESVMRSIDAFSSKIGRPPTLIAIRHLKPKFRPWQRELH